MQTLYLAEASFIMDGSDRQKGLAMVPLGAGDLIDRAVRSYRKNFSVFVMIAAPPVVIGTLISVAWTVTGRQLFDLSTDKDSDEAFFYYIFIGFGSILIWLAETIVTLIVMGGASRNYVRSLLFGDEISFRNTYSNAWERFGGLFGAAITITLSLGFLGIVIFYMGMFIAIMAVALVVGIFASVPIVAFIFSVIVFAAVLTGTLWLFFLAASRVVFVPQVMMVEEQGFGDAISRSFKLATGSTWRLAALFVFTSLAAYSALALLYVPLGWYASMHGVNILSFDTEIIPAWYEVAYNLIWQVSFILLSPVWMIGLCLLYIDVRVRAEGFDIELMAASRLGEVPSQTTGSGRMSETPTAGRHTGSSSYSPLGLGR